jgi:transposase
MRAYSDDLRRRILRAVDQGKPRTEIIQTFAVSRSTIKCYLKLRRETGDVKPKAIPGRPSKKGAALHAGLLQQLEAHPDATLTEYCQFWEATHGIHVSSATMSRAITRLNWTRKKKTIRASEQSEADRAAWREQAKTLDASKLVFIDECGSNIALTRLYARSPKGKRASGSVPRNRRANITLLASLSLQGMGEAFILEGSADGASKLRERLHINAHIGQGDSISHQFLLGAHSVTSGFLKEDSACFLTSSVIFLSENHGGKEVSFSAELSHQ